MGKLTELSAKTWAAIIATKEAQRMGNAILANLILIGAITGASVLPLYQKLA